MMWLVDWKHRAKRQQQYVCCSRIWDYGFTGPYRTGANRVRLVWPPSQVKPNLESQATTKLHISISKLSWNECGCMFVRACIRWKYNSAVCVIAYFRNARRAAAAVAVTVQSLPLLSTSNKYVRLQYGLTRLFMCKPHAAPSPIGYQHKATQSSPSVPIHTVKHK